MIVFATDLYAKKRPIDVEPMEQTLLRRMYTGAFGDGPGLAYGDDLDAGASPVVHTGLAFRAMSGLGLVEWMDHTNQAGWARGMWGARLTALGANVAFEHDGSTRRKRDGHPGCGGYWTSDGRCDDCRAMRPLDFNAYLDWLDHLPEVDRERQLAGPRLWCIEHGWMRLEDINTQKVCHLPGTHLHDGSLDRI